jgi:hypothetical protein
MQSRRPAKIKRIKPRFSTAAWVPDRISPTVSLGPNPRTMPPGESPVQTKTMFCSEGNPICIFVTNKGGIHKRQKMRFPSAEPALAWCRENGSKLFYTALRLDAN